MERNISKLGGPGGPTPNRSSEDKRRKCKEESKNNFKLFPEVKGHEPPI